MKGILLLSHGEMALGMLDTLKYFFIDEMGQADCLVLTADDDLSSYDEKLREKVNELDSGDGVLIFADLATGTPANVATALILEKGEDCGLVLYTGCNLAMVLEAMSGRDGDVLSDELIELGKSQIRCVNQLLKEE